MWDLGFGVWAVRVVLGLGPLRAVKGGGGVGAFVEGS